MVVHFDVRAGRNQRVDDGCGVGHGGGVQWGAVAHENVEGRTTCCGEKRPRRGDIASKSCLVERRVPPIRRCPKVRPLE